MGVVFVSADEVGQPDDHQPQDGDEDADPLTGEQAAPQESHREQTGEDDDRPAKHLEAGGTRHVQSWRTKERALRSESGFVQEKGIAKVLTDIHDGGSRHVTHGGREEEQGVEALAGVHPRFGPAFVVEQQDVEDDETAELAKKHPHRLNTRKEM